MCIKGAAESRLESIKTDVRGLWPWITMDDVEMRGREMEEAYPDESRVIEKSLDRR